MVCCPVILRWAASKNPEQMTIAYGVGGYVQAVTRFDGTVVSNSYDTDGRLAKSVFPGITNTFAYYRNNLLKTASNGAGTISNAYDAVNRLISVSQPVPSGTVQYTYHPAGQVSSVVSVAGTTIYSYDAAERVTGIAAPEGTFTFTYNTNNGRIATVSYPNGVTGTYRYDLMDRVTNITWIGPQTNMLRSFVYLYNSADLITNITYETGEKVAYTYDSLDQLTGERHTGPQGQVIWEATYAYDLAGNRTTKTRDGVSVSYSYGSGDRLTGLSASSTGSLKGAVDVFGYASEAIGTNDQLGERTVNSVTPQVSGTNFWVNELPVDAGTQQIVAAIGDVAGNVGRTTNTITMKVVTNASSLLNAAGCVTNIQYQGSQFSNNLSLAWDGLYQLLSARTNGVLAESYQMRRGVRPCLMLKGCVRRFGRIGTSRPGVTTVSATAATITASCCSSPRIAIAPQSPTLRTRQDPAGQAYALPRPA